uniref:hypothetical protein n=1 Tax=Pedobacter schmidteae TaxID=2201271 RepID=UPI0013CF0F5F|nr:hypothetical protein [Pedobacter schmidteae]
MVHPRLTHDPALMRGEAGTVIGADLASDTIMVAFGNKGTGNYHSDALLVLKPPQELYKDLLVKVKQLEIDDFKSLLRLSMHQDSGSPRQIVDAFAALSSSTAALEFATRPLSEHLELHYADDLDRENSLGMGR